MGNKSCCQGGSGWASWTGCSLLSELSKSSHRLFRRLCVCQPTCPHPPPLSSSLALHPSSPPSSVHLLLLYPRPHWSAVPRLLPADQSAWCLLCLGEVNKLLGQSNGKRGGRSGRWRRGVDGRDERFEGFQNSLHKPLLGDIFAIELKTMVATVRQKHLVKVTE